MSYQVLARKWRPHNFNEIVGQKHVVTSLANALQHNRLHHAYLFTGTRGVGKTTIARILAKALNCLSLDGVNPCGRCEVCVALDEGRFLDLVEVDAASRTKVEDTRELLENAQYAPHSGQYKVYLIDEVHMLSTHSFNALLKTLEEPPAHVKFLLATTDPQKIPVTVLSRCLQFNLKRLLPDEISRQMQFILDAENIIGDASALELLARAADGSMRDGLSLLDQAIVYGNGAVNAEAVREMLGTIAQHPVEHVLRALAQGDVENLLQVIAQIADLAADFSDVLQQLLRLLHQIALQQAMSNAAKSHTEKNIPDDLSALFTPEDVQFYYQVALHGQRDLPLAPDPRCGFEMLMLRMLAFKPQTPPANNPSAPLRPPDKNDAESPVISVPETRQPAALEKPVAALNESPVAGQECDWGAMVKAMKISSMTRELANNCILESLDGQRCELLLHSSHKQLHSSRAADKLQKALQNYLGKPVKLQISISDQAGQAAATPAAQLNQQRLERQKSAEQAIADDVNIRALQENFDARVVPGSIEPKD